MFGLDLTIIAFIGLVGLSVAGILFALFFNKVEAERNTDRRLGSIKSGKEGRSNRMQAEAQKVDAAKRRQSMQKSLQELEETTKAKDPNKVSLKELIRQAGMDITVKQFYVYSVVFGIIFGIVMFVVSGNPYIAGASLVIGILGMPRWFVTFRKKRRMNAFLEEFPNAVDVITRGIKAGLGIIAAEAKEPVRTEFQKIMETQKMGIPMTEAIQKLYKSMPLTEANFFGIVIAIQQSAGGNLSEALSNLSTVLRDRKKMKAKIKAMSAEAKASAGIIGCLPIIVAVLIYITTTTPAYISLLFTEDTGNLILLGSGIWMGMGIMVMRQMINFDF